MVVNQGSCVLLKLLRGAPASKCMSNFCNPDDHGVEILSGSAGATFSRAIEPAVSGVARFDALSVDFPGTYGLRALACEIERETDVGVQEDPGASFSEWI